jgi:hypothetical protein
MSNADGSFSGYLACANLFQYELKQRRFRIGNTDDQAPVLARVQTRQCNGAFAVNKAGDIGSNVWWQFTRLPILVHRQSYIS